MPLDLFDITGLEFEKPETRGKIIEETIQNKLDKLRSGKPNSTEKKQIDFLEETKSLYVVNGKATQAYFDLCASRLKQAEAECEMIAKNYNGKTITNVLLKKYHYKIGISEKRIKDCFLKFGVKIEESDLNINTVIFSSQVTGLYELIELLRKSKNPDPNGLSPSMVTDIYSLAAFSDNNTDVQEYKSKTPSELIVLFDRYAMVTQKLPSGDSYYDIIKSIPTKASLVCKADSGLIRFEQYVKFKSDTMTELFNELKYLNGSRLLYDPQYADGKILKIQQVIGCDYSDAIIIYNQEANIKKEPYLPEIIKYQIVCSCCGTVNEFPDEHSVNLDTKCSNSICGKPLLKKCSNCGGLIPFKSNSCSNCGFHFSDDVAFKKYFQAAQTAIQFGRIEEAEDYALKAASANPNAKSQIDTLRSAINVLRSKYDPAYKELNALIAAKKYTEAGRRCNAIELEFKGINISSQKKIIQDMIARCNSLYYSAQNYNQANKANAMVDILRICADYTQAIEYLRANAPMPCSNLHANANDVATSINISWNNSTEKGVKYRIIRKEGAVPPANASDGRLIADDYLDCSFEDRNVTSGNAYSYAVFAKREGVFSRGVTKTVYALGRVTNVQYTQTGNQVRFTWNSPANCDAVVVYKIIEGNKAVVSRNARCEITDSVAYNVNHIYRFIAVYAALKQGSEETEVRFTPVENIRDFSISYEKQSRNTYELKWDITISGVDLQIYINGSLYKKSQSQFKSIALNLPDNGIYNIFVQAFSGGKWKQSKNSLSINTYRPIEFETKAEDISLSSAPGSKGKVEITITPRGNLSQNVSKIIYFIRTKANEDAKAPWVRPEDVLNASDGKVLTINSHNSPIIKYQVIAHEEDSYYLTLYTVFYNNGKELLSEAAHRKIQRPINANLYWKVTKSLFGAEKKLIIELESNRPIDTRPGFKLCASTTGRRLLNSESLGALLLFETGERTYNSYEKTHKESFNIDCNIPKGQPLALFLDQPAENEIITPRWVEGFNGKL